MLIYPDPYSLHPFQNNRHAAIQFTGQTFRYGAPSVSGERIAAGTEIFAALESLNRVPSYDDFQAIVADAIGGGNGLATSPTSAQHDQPIDDADMVGRAYPGMEHGYTLHLW